MLRTMGAAWSGAISPLAAFFQASSATPAIRMSGAISSWPSTSSERACGRSGSSTNHFMATPGSITTIIVFLQTQFKFLSPARGRGQVRGQ